MWRGFFAVMHLNLHSTLLVSFICRYIEMMHRRCESRKIRVWTWKKKRNKDKKRNLRKNAKKRKYISKKHTMKNPKWHVITSLAFDLPHGGRSDRARESDDLTSDLPVSRCTATVQSFTTSGRHIDFKTGSEIRIALNTCCCRMLHGSIWLNTHTNRDLASARNELHLAQHLHLKWSA